MLDEQEMIMNKLRLMERENEGWWVAIRKRTR